MEIKVVRSTGNYKTKKEFLNFSKICGRQCYSEKDWEDLEKEPHNPKFIDDKLKKGHHSFF